jgi:hypothetical protein
MDYRMRRTVLLGCALAALTATAWAQQPATPAQNDQQGQPQNQGQYQGQSNPPDDVITTAPQNSPSQDQPKPKPSPGKPMVAPQPASPAVNPIVNGADPNAGMSPAPNTAQSPGQNSPMGADNGPDNGIVQVAPPAGQPALMTRNASADPDGDIVHPAALPPGTLEEGARIRVRLLTELSSSRSVKGDSFRGRVDVDVLQDGQVLIPAGAEISGKVVEASGGHFAGHGTLRLRPETVILPNGQQYMLVARMAGMENSRMRVDREGTIEAGTRYKKDGVEYGGGVGAGVVAGAVIGGPVGALAGGLVGAGLVTVHLMMDHPQATLEPGSTLLFTLSDRLSLVATNATGN